MVQEAQHRRVHDEYLDARVRSWNHHPVFAPYDPAARIDLVAASAGEFHASVTCPSPRLWLLLVGQLRTFHWAQHSLQRMAHHSSGGCYMAAAVLPDEICTHNLTSTEEWRKGHQQPLTNVTSAESVGCAHPRFYTAEQHRTIDWRVFAKSINDVQGPLDLAAKTTFQGRLAYAVIRRSGMFADYPQGLPPMWHLVWAVAEWSSRRNGFTTAPYTVVIRTRPDAIFSVRFLLDPLSRFFANGGLHARHVLLVQNLPPVSSDTFMVTSFACYASDIARPMEGWMLHRAVDAGWGLPFRRVLGERRCVCLTPRYHRDGSQVSQCLPTHATLTGTLTVTLVPRLCYAYVTRMVTAHVPPHVPRAKLSTRPHLCF